LLLIGKVSSLKNSKGAVSVRARIFKTMRENKFALSDESSEAFW